MDISKPILTEPGIKYFLHQTLKQCHITKNAFHTAVFNIGLLLGFIIILAAILFFKYKGKTTPAEKQKKDYEKQQYILSKITKLQNTKRIERQELITGLPNWENEYDTFNKNPHS
jgi:hypothetical protein